MIHKIISLINYYTGKYLAQKKQENKEKIDKQWKNYFLNDNKFIFKLRHNISIYLYNDSVLARLIYEGFEKNEIDYIEKNLNNGDIFVDIGANIGLFSLIASQLVGEKGKVISFEPSPITFNRLQENINLNNFSNIEIVNKGISDNVGNLSINLYEEGFDAFNYTEKMGNALLVCGDVYLWILLMETAFDRSISGYCRCHFPGGHSSSRTGCGGSGTADNHSFGTRY